MLLFILYHADTCKEVQSRHTGQIPLVRTEEKDTLQ